MRSQYKDCGGASICEHGRRRSQYKEYGGSHVRAWQEEVAVQSARCKECGGASVCKYNRQKSTCKECGVASFCEHDKYKSKCSECKAFKMECKQLQIFSLMHQQIPVGNGISRGQP